MVFEFMGDYAWLICWGFLVAVQLILTFIAPTFIMPLFNKFVPLEEGELKQLIQSYADKYKFGLDGVFTMDGSKRSTKSNAFLLGLENLGGLFYLIR